jgi:DNA topoisomerase-1
VTVDDARLARLVRRCSELGGQKLFAYDDGDGGVSDVTSTDVNDYLQAVVGADTSAKDFRTWGGTVIATESLATRERAEDERTREADILAAVDDAAAALHNTRTVCRQCYVHPAVPEAYRDGTLAEHWNRSRTTARLRRAERATLAVLGA